MGSGPLAQTLDCVPWLSGQGFSLVILNWRQPKCIVDLWRKASFRVLADGGADRLRDDIARTLSGETQQPLEVARGELLPDLIVGDMDSASKAACDYYRSKGVTIEDMSHDQDTTDLMKCLSAVRSRRGAQETVIVTGAFGGRLDHSLANLWALHMSPEQDIVLVGDGNAARLVPTGRSRVSVNRDVQGPECGLVPLLGPATVTTAGLHWDVHDTVLSFDRIISTSNRLAADLIEVETSSPLVFTVRCDALSDLTVPGA